MTRKSGWLVRVVAMLALGFTFAGAAFAQTTTSVERNFEVIWVDGNQLVFRDERGTNELTVPDGFRFTVDGKQLGVSDLKPGMKGTATVTTTVTPIVVTEIRQGVVLSVQPYSLTVKDEADGLRKRFTQTQLQERGIKIFKDGRPIAIRDLRQGDVLTATIVTQDPPVVVTEQEVQATLAQEASATPATTEAPAAAAEPAASAQPAADAPAMAASPASAPAESESSGLGTMGWLLIVVLIAAALFFFVRRRKGQ